MGRLRRTRDDGFTLIEVMVAMMIFGLVAAATTPLLLKAIDATQTGKLNTQGKNLLQLRIDSMRNLPFHVATSAGPYIDLLDTYFRDASGSDTNSSCDTYAYTAATYTYTCNRSAAGGKLGLPGFSERVDAQFVDQNNAVVHPQTGYDSQASLLDVPPSNTLSVTVTETWSLKGASKTFSASTQISANATGLPEVVSRIRDSAISIKTATDDTAIPTTLQFDAGLVNATTGLSTGATANAQVQGALGTMSTGQTTSGSGSGYLDAPPDQSGFIANSGSASTGVPCSSLFVCFGATSASNVNGSASNGIPQAGSSGSPLTASVVKSGSVGARGFWVSNVPTGTTQATLVRLGVQSAGSPPTASAPTQVVRSVQAGSNAGYTASCTAPGTAVTNADFVTSTGYIATTAGATHAVTSCAAATTRRIDLFPLAGGSAFNQDGVVQVVLQYAGLQCSASSSTGQVTKTFRGTVSFMPYGASSPTVLTIDSAQTSDPLTAGLLAKNSTTGIQIGVDAGGSPIWLGDYVSSWSSASFSKSEVSKSTQADLKVITISTVPTRDADTLGQSSLNLVLGQLSCLAQDNR
jgi:prepilin-type N-terminal cleavage/methylation domain-containing protein